MAKRVISISSVVSILVLGLTVPELAAGVSYPSEILTLEELTRGVKEASAVSRAADIQIANTISMAEEQLADQPSSIAHREMLRLYTGTEAGMPRLIFAEDGPMCWSVPLVRDEAIVGFLLFNPYTASLMATPMWQAGGDPAVSVSEKEWNELERLVTRALGISVGSEARLIQIVNGYAFLLYLAVPEHGEVYRVDVTSLGEPGGLHPRRLVDQPVTQIPPSCIRREPPAPSETSGSGYSLDFPIPTSFSLAVMPRVIDQCAYGACTGHAATSTREWWECGAICYDGTGNSGEYTCECDKNYYGTCYDCIVINLSREYMYDRTRTWPEGYVYDMDCDVYGFCINNSCGQGTCTNNLVTDGDMMSNNPYCHQCGGANPADAAAVLVGEGTCTEACQPYPNYGYAGPQHAGCTNGGREACTDQCWNVTGPCGDDFKLQSYGEVMTVEEITDAVYHHGPVLGGGAICSPCWMGIGSNGCVCYPTCPCPIAGGHAYMIYGYDNDYNPPILYLQNSWGTGWGQIGRGMTSQAAYTQFHTPPDFYFVGGKDIRITVSPHSTVVPRGGTLSLTATVENFSDQPQSFSAWTDVYLPNGNPYPGNPVAGPKSVTLQPYQQVSRELNHFVPNVAPLGFYRYVGCVGIYPMQVDDDDEFIFIVTP
ncbi:hypothetical protein AMJ82_11485 [candidate division TA06 bacterium SM23_40]|uniref:Peptidase C1A papain C-terminal domain-containing protein n=1 Tax=candidate division TA06 bacterium SM23_40 TaxID=1703774 RepID=A0A0S8G290_UNCT6|nr:MAG: hypothetical protein AMJ82_11485 [candidate division TA06 bacterium SM23_40]